MSGIPDDVASSAMMMTMALDELVRAVAETALPARTLLATCYRCRNHLLYLMDTAPYSGQAHTQLARRLAALPDNHQHFHGNGDAHTARPVIRGLA